MMEPWFFLDVADNTDGNFLMKYYPSTLLYFFSTLTPTYIGIQSTTYLKTSNGVKAVNIHNEELFMPGKMKLNHIPYPSLIDAPMCTNKNVLTVTAQIWKTTWR